jgi:hypothetical protein
VTTTLPANWKFLLRKLRRSSNCIELQDRGLPRFRPIRFGRSAHGATLMGSMRFDDRDPMIEAGRLVSRIQWHSNWAVYKIVKCRYATVATPIPLWIISGHRVRSTSCLLYPRKRHQLSALRCPLSAKSGHSVARRKRCYSITSSAVASSVCGIVSPSAFPLLRLMTRSNLVGC